MDNHDQLSDIAEAIQRECHETVEFIFQNNPKSSYQDATNCFIFRKLAELQLSLQEVRNEKFSSGIQ